MRILQLSDPHLVAADQGLVRGRPALAHFERALQVGGALNPDLMLVTGDLCQDESWGGYARLRRALRQQVRCSVASAACALGSLQRQWLAVAPAVLGPP